MYLVTGATGNVGSALVDQLLENGQRVRVFVRETHKAAHWGDRIEIATGDFSEVESFGRALAGTEGVFLMNPAAEVGNFPQLIAAAQKQQARRIVFLSSLFASIPGIKIGEVHKKKEDAIRQAGIQAYFLRAGGFMSNSRQWAASIKEQGVVYNPTGSGKIAAIAPEDIAVMAAKLLTSSRDGVEDTPEITGSELMSAPEQVVVLAGAIGKPIRCVDVPAEAAVDGMKRNGMPPQMAAALGESIAVVRDGRAEHQTDTFERIMGRKPMTFAEWAERHVAEFG